jgi:hypothetical protein
VRTTVVIRRTALATRQLFGSLQRGWQNCSRALAQAVVDRLAQLQWPGRREDQWPLAGGLWLGICGLLLATFMLAG